MSCQLTYRGKQYESNEDLRNEILKQHLAEGMVFPKIPLSQISPDAEAIMSEFDLFIEGFDNYRSYKKVSDQLQKKVKDLSFKLQSLKSQKRQLHKGDSERYKKLSEEIYNMEQRIAKTEKQLQLSQSLDGTQSLYELALRELDDIKGLFDDVKNLPPREYINKIAFALESLKFWEAVGTIDDLQSHIIMSKEDLSSPEVREKIFMIGAKAKEILAQVSTVNQQKLLQEIKSNVKGHDVSLDDIKFTKDLRFWNNKETFDIGVMGDAMLATIQLLQKEQITSALFAIDRTFKNMDEAFQKALPVYGNNMDNLTDAFMQKYADGTKTNRLVFRFTPEFFDAAKQAYFEYKNSKNKSSYEKFSNWMRENQILINPVILFPTQQGDIYHFGDGKNMRSSYSNAIREAHIAELKDALGEKDFELYMEKMKENLDRFAFQYSEQKAFIDGLNVSEEVKKEMLHDWELEFSPYYWAEKIMNNRLLQNSGGVYVRNKGFEYILSIPKKYKPDGSLTGYYDTRYEKIQSNPATAELYDVILNITTTLSDMLPAKQRKELGINGIPVLRNFITDMFLKDRGKGLSEELYDRFIESIRTTEELNIDYRERDAVTGAVRFKAVSHLDTGEEEIKKITELKLVKYKVENPEQFKALGNNIKQIRALEFKLKAEFRKQAISELNSRNTTDLQTTLRAYAMSAIMYSHKAAIEGIMNVMADVANDRQAFVTKDGRPQKDANGEYQLQGTAKKKVEALRYNLESFFTGKMHKTQYVSSSKKVYTSKETKRRKEIESLIEENKKRFEAGELSETMYLKNKSILEEQLGDLGGNVEGAKIIDNFLKLNGLLGLGWNITSAFNNMAFGYLANSTEAAREMFFDDATLNTARRLLTSSVLRNFSFNSYNNKNALKIRAILDKLDTLKDASTELYKAQMKSKNFSKIQFLSAYQLNKRTEYLNQGQTALAYLLFQKIKTKDGNEISIFEALDDNGEWRSDLVDEPSIQEFGNLKSRIDQLIKRLHGNYDELSPLQGKENVLGRLVFQFKSWAPETLRKFFGSETPDYILGDVYKGRYVTLVDTLLLNPEWKKNWLDSFRQFFKVYLNITSFGLIKKFGENNSFSHLSKTDMANMKANIRQLIFIINIYMLYYGLKYGMDDDEKNELGNVTRFVLLNQLSRLQTDLTMYSDINELNSFFGNMIPIGSLVKQSYDVIKALGKTISGDYYMQRGAFDGWYRVPKEVMELLPITAPAMRTYSVMTGETIRNQKTLLEEFLPESEE